VTLEVTSSDDNMDNNSGTLFVQASTTMAASTHVTMEMKTDQYGSETSWKLFKPMAPCSPKADPMRATPCTTTLGTCKT
jgi:hypothetical protein